MQITLQERGIPLPDNGREVFDRDGDYQQDGFFDYASDQRDQVDD